MGDIIDLSSIKKLTAEIELLRQTLEDIKNQLPESVYQKTAELLEDLKIELQEFNQINRERTKKLQSYIQKTNQTLQSLEQSASEIRKDYENLNEVIAQQINANLNYLQTELSALINRLKEIELEIKKSAKEGIEEGLTEQVEKIRKTLDEIYFELYKDLVEIQKTLKAIRKEFDKYQNTIENVFKKWQWSWVGACAFFSALTLTGLLFIGLENANQDQAVEVLLEFLEIIFLISATYLSVKIWNKLQKPLVGYILSAILLTIAGFIGYTTYKGKIQIVKVFEPIKPNNVVKQTDGSICYFFDGYYLGDDEKWHQGKIAICTPPPQK